SHRIPPPPSPTLFPYTTLFRSLADEGDRHADGHAERHHDHRYQPGLVVDPVQPQGGEHAQGDAGEGAVGEGVAEERHAVANDERSEERRVGKECRSGWWTGE